jgi:protein SCO1/2
MKNILHHHWTRAEKKLATRYGQLSALAILLGVLVAAGTILWQLSADQQRLDFMHKTATVVTASKHSQAQIAIPPNGKPIGGPFMLTNQNGKTVTDKDFLGKYLLVYFGYTYCPDMCPTGLQSIAASLDALGKDADKVQPLFITIDPARDTPAKLKEYVATFHPRIIGLTGTADQIATAAKSYQVYYAKGEMVDDKDYVMDHSSLIYLMDKDGKFISVFDEEVDPVQLAKAIKDQLAKK